MLPNYLDRLRSNLTILKRLLVEDITLQELANSPLLLNIMVLAYQDTEIPFNNIALNRKKQLFDDYINRIFQGSKSFAYLPKSEIKEESIYLRKNATYWLEWMANQMIKHSQTIFFIEKMQFSWLKSTEKNFWLIASIIIYGLILFLMYQIDFPKYIRTQTQIYIEVISYIVTTIFSALITASYIGSDIEPIESIKWSWSQFINLTISGFILGLIISLIWMIRNDFQIYDDDWYVQTIDLIGNQNNGFIVNIIIFILIFNQYNSPLIFCLMVGIFAGICEGFTLSAVETKNLPNQGIKKSLINSLIYGLISGLITNLIINMAYFVAQFNGLINTPFFNVSATIALIIGLLFGWFFGGKACIQHFVLRLILHLAGHILWNYAKFLDWASDKLFLQKVGGGYIFIHRSLMEHFAEMEKN